MNKSYKVAVLIDGAFLLKRLQKLVAGFNERTAPQVANDIHRMALKHVGKGNELYRIYYYDCRPLDKKFHHPLTGRMIDWKKEKRSLFRNELFEQLKRKRKVALRLGHLAENGKWQIDTRHTKEILKGSLRLELLGEQDVHLEIRQKGVDMKIGVDIATLAYKKLVDRIILVAGDADFVPASKLARIEGIDFILDPIWNPINGALLEHVDGILSVFPDPGEQQAA